MVGNADGGPCRTAESDVDVSTMLVFFDLTAKLFQRGQRLLLAFGAVRIEVEFLPFGESKLDGFFAVREALVDMPVPGVEA